MYLYFSEFNKNHYTFDYYPDIIRLNDGWRKKVMASKVWYIPAQNELLVKRVGIYCRVSTSEKAQLYSLSNQISALTRAVADVTQWRLTDVFIDIASAKGSTPRREFDRLIKECEAHNISVVLTKSISRFGRDMV